MSPPAYGIEHIGEGDEIVLTIMEHHANIVPWHFLRERKGAVLKWVDVADDGSLSLEGFAEAIGPRTKMVAVSAMSNVLGTVAPIPEIVALAHARGIPVLVDGSQAAVHGMVDVQALDVDFFVVTGHKLYGPTGIGVLYGKAERLAELPPFNGGGEMIQEVTTETVTYNAPPHRFEAGTPPIAQAVGLGAALDYIEGVGRTAIAAHEAALTAYAHERLGAINSLRIIGTAPGKGPILSFTMEGAHAHDIATLIDRSGRRGAGRHALRDAAVAAVRRHLDVPRLVRALQHPRRDRRARRRARQSAKTVSSEIAMSDTQTLAAKAPSSMSPEEIAELTDAIVAALKTVYDPEIPADIYELGLIYNVDIDDERNVAIEMTLTAPGCPVAGEMPVWVENAVSAVPGVKHAKATIVFDPPWDQSRMSDEARVALDMF